MITTIPPEAHSAAHRAFRIAHEETGSVGEAVDAACLAMLNAWPGAFPHTFRGPLEGYGLVLPLPTDAADE